MDFKDVLNHDEKFRYMLLSRMKSDCDYYLGNGGRCAKHLWAGDEVKQIAYMKALWNSFGENDKPEWLTRDELLDYEKKIGIKAILVEMDYKGCYERFALTPDEFKEEFPETFEHFGPIEESNSDTIRPLVHIWFEPCMVGDGSWENFFTDMEEGLPESDIESGNLAYIDKNQMQSLNKYLEDVAVYRCRTEVLHDDISFAENEVKSRVMNAVQNSNYFISNFKCVYDGLTSWPKEYSNVHVFAFDYEIRMPRDAQVFIAFILDRVEESEFVNLTEFVDFWYEPSEESVSLEDKIKDAQGKVVEPAGVDGPKREER